MNIASINNIRLSALSALSVPLETTSLFRVDNVEYTSIFVSWDAVEGATNYSIEFKLTSEPTIWTFSSNTGSRLVHDIPFLTPNSSYDVRLKVFIEDVWEEVGITTAVTIDFPLTRGGVGAPTVPTIYVSQANGAGADFRVDLSDSIDPDGIRQYWTYVSLDGITFTYAGTYFLGSNFTYYGEYDTNHWFKGTAIDNTGQESDFSNIVGPLQVEDK
jgi:hypothetical protein